MLNINKFSRKVATIFALIFSMSGSVSYASSLTNTIDDWIDPAIGHKKAEVAVVVKKLQESNTVRIPPRIVNEDFGYSFAPATQYDFMALRIIRSMSERFGRRANVLDCGCGHGFMSTLAVLAGGKVDAVDFKDTVTLANKTIYQNTKGIYNYKASEAKSYYSAFPQSLIANDNPSWMKTTHEVIICNNVIHFFGEKELKLFAKRIYDNLITDGAFMVMADAPFIHELSMKYRAGREGKAYCPSLGVYTKKNGSKGLGLTHEPVPYDESKGLEMNHVYNGIYHVEGKLTELDSFYHNVRNMFTTEDIRRIFSDAGLMPSVSYYLDSNSTILPMGVNPPVGKPSKACVMFVKP